MTMAMKTTPSSTTSTSSSRRPARPLACLLIATITGSCHSYAPSKIISNSPLCIQGTSSSSSSRTSLSARLPPGQGQGNKNKAVVKKPAWQENAEYWAEREALEKLNKNGGGSGGGSKNAEILDYLDELNDGGNTFAKMYVPKSTDDFKKPYDPDDEDNYNVFAPSVPPPRKPKRVESERSSSSRSSSSNNPPLNAAVEGEDQTPSWFGSNERQPDNNGRNGIMAGGQVAATVSNNAADANRHAFQMSSTDDFRKPHGSVPNNVASGNNQQRHSNPPPPPQQAQPFNPNANRHSFQTKSTDDFRKPHGMPSDMEQQQRPPPSRKDAYKSPFQTSSTDEFRRPSDVASGVGAAQQPIFQRPESRAENPAWRNGVGRDTYGSTLHSKQPSSQGGGWGGGGMPNQFQNFVDQAQNFGEQAQQAFQSMHPPKFMDAMIIDNDSPQPPTTQTVAPVASNGLDEWDQRLQTAHTKSSRTMLRRIQWPLSKDPPGVCPDHPLLATRVFATLLATLSTRYLHLHAGYSPVLASSATTLLLSTCVDRRLGQAALCGSLAGMSGGHLTATLPVAVGLGAVASACYEVAIRINDAASGIGGRLGATAFLATSIVARYRGVGGVGRKLRRGLWKSGGGGGPSDIAVSMVLYHALGSVATILLRESSGDDAGAAADPVRASSVVGLLGSLFLKDPTAVLALYGGSFVGMSLPSRLMNGSVPDNNIRAAQRLQTTAVSLFASFAGAGAMAGLLHAVSIHAGYWNGGWGGKVGLCAFAGCWVYRGFGNVAQFINRRT